MFLLIIPFSTLYFPDAPPPRFSNSAFERRFNDLGVSNNGGSSSSSTGGLTNGHPGGAHSPLNHLNNPAGFSNSMGFGSSFSGGPLGGSSDRQQQHQQQHRFPNSNQPHHHLLHHPGNSSSSSSWQQQGGKDWQEGLRALLPNINVSFGNLPTNNYQQSSLGHPENNLRIPFSRNQATHGRDDHNELSQQQQHFHQHQQQQQPSRSTNLGN